MRRFLVVLLLSASAFAAPVSVSSTTVSGQNITVNTTAAHGLAVNQADCLSAPTNVCGVVTTVNTGTQFVLLVAGTTPSACASSCGTETPAPQVIVLTSSTTQGFTTWTWLNWATTTQPCPGPSSSSWVASNGSAGASAAQKSAILNGLIIEHLRSVTVAASLPIATVELMLQNDYNSDQASSSQPCQFFGFTFDVTTNAWLKQ